MSPEHWITLALVAIAGVLAFISAWQQAGKADREELRREALLTLQEGRMEDEALEPLRARVRDARRPDAHAVTGERPGLRSRR
jgi:hypothetical protein